MRLYYAQNREDLLIKSFFPDITKGFYIDVGANDPVIDSVTKLFYEEGWRGINVEPIKRHFDALQRLRPADTNVQIGLSDKSGKLEFTEYSEGDGLSTFDMSMQEFYESGNHAFQTQKYKKYEVEVQTLQHLIDKQLPEHIHFIKIDVEGYEAEVINGYSWKNIRPELICIEANHIHNDWEVVLQKNKYHEVFFDGLNKYYLAEESLFRKDYFYYPDAVFAGNPIYYQAYLEMEEAILEQPKRQIADKEQQIAVLHQQQRDVRFLAKRLGIEVQHRLNKRSKGVATSEHLHYDESAEIDTLVQSDNKSHILKEVHKLDKHNIRQSKVTVKDQLKPVGWKLAAGTVNTGIRVAKGVRRGK